MSSALVVGVGAVGARAARHLVSDGTHVLLADARRGHLDQVVESLGSSHAEVWTGAPEDAEVDVVVLCLGGAHAELASRCLRAGHDVVSSADDPDDVRRLLDLDAEATERARHVVVGAGFSPGFTCLLAAHAAGTLDAIDEIHVSRVGTGGPACAEAHHRALSGDAFDWRDGGWVNRSAGSGRELCWFPDPIGGRDCYRAALAEPLLLVRAFPSTGRITSRQAANRRARLTSRLPMLRPPHADGGPGAVRVELRGARAGARATVVYGAMDVPSAAAGAVAARAAALVVEGGLRRKGAGGLAELTDPRPVLQALAERGVKAATFTG
jgi:hypothetical protein